MKKLYIICAVCLMFFMSPNIAFAHPGRTDSNGCHTCKTNCSSWGLNYNEYHCHNGNTYTNSKGQIFNSNGVLISDSSSNNNDIIYQKSNNANIKSLLIDGNSVNITNEMSFSTSNLEPNIIVIPEHSKATVKIDKPSILSNELMNEITISVTAEDLTTKVYKLYIKVASNDASINSLKINEESIDINDEMFYSTTSEKIKLNVVTNNENAKIISNLEYDLNNGDNKIIIKVKAEDGVTEKEYILNVKKNEVLSDNVEISVKVNGEKAIFKNYKSEIIYISSGDTINIEYELKDSNANTNLPKEKKIKIGDNEIKFNVVAENGRNQEYILNVHKNSNIENIIYPIIGFAFLGGIGLIIYKLIKKD